MDPLKKLAFIQGIKQNVQKSQEWLEQRKKFLTSSDAATALDINPYEKSDVLLFKKNGISKPFTGNIATKHGQDYEDEAIDIYCKLMSKKNYNFGLIEWNQINEIRSDYLNDFINSSGIDPSFLAGSPDGIAYDEQEGLVLLECKCPFGRQLKYDYCPEYYYPQVQLNMAILDIDKADFIEYIPANVVLSKGQVHDKPQFNIVRIHRDYNWLTENITKLHTFWSQVLKWRELGIVNHPMYEKMTKKKEGPSFV